jgi:hypothetical protein
MSYLFFAPEFTDELVALGRKHAGSWLEANPDVWRTGPLPG